MKIVLLAFIVVFIGTSSFSQDVIILKDNFKMEVKVIEITTSMVKYKRFDQQDGPLRNVAISEVKEIIYEDGTWDNFEHRTTTVIVEIPEIVLPEGKKKDAFHSPGIFLDLMLGYSQRQFKSQYSIYVYNPNQAQYQYTNYITLSLRFGNKWYIGKREKWRPGIQANWFRLGINLDPQDIGYSIFAGPKNLSIANVGMCNVFKFSDKIGLEANFTTGINAEFDLNYGSLIPGIAISPEVKFRYKNLAIGLNYTRIQAIDAIHALSNWDILDLSVGFKF